VFPPPPVSQRWIELENLHTGEVLKATFDRDAGPDPENAGEACNISYVTYRVNEEHAMDAALYGLLGRPRGGYRS